MVKQENVNVLMDIMKVLMIVNHVIQVVQHVQMEQNVQHVKKVINYHLKENVHRHVQMDKLILIMMENVKLLNQLIHQLIQLIHQNQINVIHGDVVHVKEKNVKKDYVNIHMQ